MDALAGKSIVISGASRGIGLAMGKRFAQDGAKVSILAKTAAPHSKLPGTIYTAAEEIRAAGGEALPVIAAFGGIDICVNNASAIVLTGTEDTPMRRYDLMQEVNARGTFCLTQACLPYLKKAENPHVLMNSPPLNMSPKWFQNHVAYTMAKYGMSMCVLGMAPEFERDGIAVNALWPRTSIATAAVQNLLGGDEIMKKSRRPEIMADAAYAIVTRPSRTCTGNFFIDDEVLQSEGVTNLDIYAMDPSQDLMPDFFLD